MAWPYIAAGASILGSIFGQESTNQSNETIARDANTAAQHNADLQMAFQERMSNTAHQREMVDLQKAGLNPLLALNTGASTPQGAAGGVATATLKNSLEGLGASAMEMMRLKNDLKKQGLTTSYISFFSSASGIPLFITADSVSAFFF